MHPPFVMVIYHMIVQLVADFPEKPLFQAKSFCSWGGRSGQENSLEVQSIMYSLE